MRIGIVVPTFPTQVTSSELWLAQGLGELGHDVIVFSSGREGARKDRGWSSGISPDPTHATKFRVREISTFAIGYSEASVPTRLSQIFSERPEVLLLQEDYPPLSQIVAGAARRRHIPYLVTSERYSDHGPWLVRVTVRALDRSILPRLWRHSAALTVHSQAARQFFLERKAPVDRLHYIPSCTDVDLFLPGPRVGGPSVEALWPDRGRDVRLLTVARWHPAKGLDTLADAVQLLRSKSVGLVSLLHGRGPMEARLRSIVAERNLSQSLLLDRSSVDLSELPGLYRSADIYVQPSLTEPFGMAALEAMACGVPVIASATGGLSDLVENEVSGLLVPPGNPGALAAAIQRLIADPELRHRMGLASRARAMATFEMGEVARAFDGLLAGLRP